MKKFIFPIVSLVILCILSNISLSQEWMPTFVNCHGDTIPYVFPLPDSIYVHNQIIIKFKEDVLKKDLLCYSIINPSSIDGINKKETINSSYEPPPEQMSMLFAQGFSIDSLILNPVLINTIKSFGGVHLKRISYANPCTDTLSITRYGDTMRINDYTWMLLEIDNDTSVTMGCISLLAEHHDNIIVAQPNFLYKPHDYPTDNYWNLQKSLQLNDNYGIGMPTFWDKTTGSHGQRVAIIDDGLDWRHCDISGMKGPDKKVLGGWNYTENNDQFYYDSKHGTPIAGIIGAYRNDSYNCTNPGIAGIAGGYDAEEWSGCRFFGYRVKVSEDKDEYATSHIISAIRRAVASSPGTKTYGDAVHIINMSFGSNQPDGALIDALDFAHEHGVSLVASAGNDGLIPPNNWQFPASHSPHERIISVGATACSHELVPYSNQVKYLDLMAPGGWIGHDDCVYSTKYDPLFNSYDYFYHTSAAAPHVTGLIALLRSIYGEWEYEVEDFEGILKATAEFAYGGYNYSDSYGWGHIDAENLYQLIVTQGYSLDHILLNQNDPEVVTTEHYWAPSKDYPAYEIYLYNDGDNKNRKFYVEGRYWVYRRPVDLEKAISGYDRNYPIYVWGTSGRGSGHAYCGWPKLLPGYFGNQVGWCHIQKGVVKDSWSPEIPGIELKDGYDFIRAETYQYEIYDYLGRKSYFPPLSKNVAYVSIFGVKLSSNINATIDHCGISVILSPNPTNEEIKISIYKHILKDNFDITLSNVLGEIIWSKSVNNQTLNEHHFNIPTINLPAGVYYCRITSGKYVETKQVIVL